MKAFAVALRVYALMVVVFSAVGAVLGWLTYESGRVHTILAACSGGIRPPGVPPPPCVAPPPLPFDPFVASWDVLVGVALAVAIGSAVVVVAKGLAQR
jgi:hypothetical protein